MGSHSPLATLLYWQLHILVELPVSQQKRFSAPRSYAGCLTNVFFLQILIVPNQRLFDHEDLRLGDLHSAFQEVEIHLLPILDYVAMVVKNFRDTCAQRCRAQFVHRLHHLVVRQPLGLECREHGGLWYLISSHMLLDVEWLVGSCIRSFSGMGLKILSRKRALEGTVLICPSLLRL